MATVKSQLILETDKAKASVKSFLASIKQGGGALSLSVDTSKALKGVGDATKTAKTQLNTLSQDSSSNFQNSWGNAISVAFGTLLAQGLSTAARGLGSFVSDSVRAAGEIQKALTSLEVIAPKFGIKGEDAIKSAQKLSKDLSIDYGVAAESLQNLLKSNIGLGQAEELMKRFSNEAITGKSATLDYGKAVQNLSFAFATNNSALGNNAGISENWTDIRARGIKVLEAQGAAMKEINKTLTEEQKQTLKSIGTKKIKINQLNSEQKDLLKYIGLIDLTNLTLGSSEKFQGGLVLKQIQLGQSIKDLQIAFGNFLAPAVVEIIDLFQPLIKRVEGFTKKLDPEIVKNFTRGILGLKDEVAAVVLAFAGIAIVSTFFSAISPLLALFGGLAGGAVTLGGAIGGLAAFFAPAIVTIGSFVVFFGLAIAAIKKLKGPAEENRSVMDTLKSAYEKFSKDVLPQLIGGFKKIVEFWKSNIQPVFDVLADYAGRILVKAFRGFKEALPGLIQAFKDFISFWRSNIQPVLGALAEVVGKILVASFDRLKDSINKFKGALPGIQAEFGNVIAKIKEAEPFINTIRDAFLKLVDIFVTFFIPVLETFINGVWNSLVLAFNTLLPTLASLSESLMRLWGVIAPVLMPVLAVLAGVIGIVLYAAITGLTVIINTLVPIIIFVINAGINVLTFAINVLASTFQFVGTILKLTWDLIIDIFTNGGKNTGQILNQAGENLKKIWDGLMGSLKELTQKMWDSLVETVKVLAVNMGSAFLTVFDAIKRVYETLNATEMGRNIIQGLIDGVKSMAGGFAGAMLDTINGGIKSAKDLLGIKSPSRLFRDQIGKQMMRGAIIGVEREEGNFNNAINRALDVSKTISNITNNYNKMITNNNSNVFTFNSSGVSGVEVLSQYAV